VFSVGDPKQSIYAFQGADPERFLGEAQNLSTRVHTAGKQFAAPELRTSFRSSPEILRAVDETMKGKPLIAGPGAHDEIVHLAARANEGGVVDVWPVTPKPAVADAAPWDAPLDMERESTAHVVLAKRSPRRSRP
jgi:ATP-dependent helicase/nuclease subunit A